MLKNLNILRPFLLTLILFIPLYPKFPLASVSGTYVAIRLDDVVVAISLLFLLIHQIKNRFSIFKQKITPIFLVYFLAIIASTVNAILIYKTDATNILLLNLFRRFEYISLFFLTVASIKNQKDLKYPYIFFVLATLGASLYGYGQKYLSLPIISTMNEEFSKGQLLQMNNWSRISSTFAGHYDLAVYMSVVLVVILGVNILIKNIPLKIITWIIWLASFQILTYTASRVSSFAFFGGAVLALILIRKYLWIIPVTAIFVFSIFNSADLNKRLLATVPTISKYFQKQKPAISPVPTPSLSITPTPIITSAPIATAKTTPTPAIVRHQPTQEVIPIDADAGVARSGEIRFNVEWPRAITAFKKNVLVGTGLGSITLATDNDYLRSLGESGLLGFISFSIIFIYFSTKTFPIIFKKDKNFYDKLSLIFFASMITMLANATFIDVFEASKTAYLFWIMMGLYYANLELGKNKK